MRSDMGKIKRISAAFLLFCVPLFAMASSSLHDLDRLCGPGQTVRVKGSVIVEGIVISSYKSENMAVIPNLTPESLDLNANLRTAYIQSPDGSKGLRVIFDEPEYNMLDRYDNVVLDLGNCLLGRDAHTGALTVSGLTPSNVSRVRKGTAGQLPLKARYVCELTDDDIYTYVTLKDMEFVFKDGSFADVRENYIKDRMDSWVSQIRDSRGGSMYLHVNMKCDWRRRGDGVPAGCGDICGIIVNDQLRRHGDSLGRYSVRPVDREDIFVPKKGKSSWKVITGVLTALWVAVFSLRMPVRWRTLPRKVSRKTGSSMIWVHRDFSGQMLEARSGSRWILTGSRLKRTECHRMEPSISGLLRETGTGSTSSARWKGPAP